MKPLVLLVLAACIAGCVTVAPSTEMKGITETNVRRERNYDLGVERTAVVGDPIVRVRGFLEEVTQYAAFEVSEDFRLSGGPVTLVFAQGEKLPIAGERVNNGTTYTVVRKDGFYGVQVAPDGSVGASLINGLGTDVQGGDGISIHRYAINRPTPTNGSEERS